MPDDVPPGGPAAAPAIHLRTLCFVWDGGRTLLIHRRRPPNSGLLNAIGGKLEPGEDPFTAAVREVEEETGVRVHRLDLRAIVTIHVRTTGARWVLFTFCADLPEGAVVRASDEGLLEWVETEAIRALPVPRDIPLMLPYLVDRSRPILMANLTYETDDAASMLTYELREA